MLHAWDDLTAGKKINNQREEKHLISCHVQY